MSEFNDTDHWAIKMYFVQRARLHKNWLRGSLLINPRAIFTLISDLSL